jgi:pimeloyl-ACP methyl ester carboxylesterase
MLLKPFLAAFIVTLLGASAEAQSPSPSPTPPAGRKLPAPVTSYGSNPSAGNTFTHDGVKLYYEVYGSGEPVLMIHGNGSSIGEMTAQIEYFRKRYQVIAMDSRDHGKSADSADQLTYEKMTDDLAALLDHLKSPPVNVLGWSDGGIEALLLAIRHPAKVKKIATMAANLNPEGLHPDILAWIKSGLDSAPAAGKATREQKRNLKVTRMMLVEPHIDPRVLERIRVPALVLASDHDAISDEHTLEIYHHLANGQLCIFPNATHMIPYDDPDLFNSTVERFLRTPFVKKDRIRDLVNSNEALRRSH